MSLDRLRSLFDAARDRLSVRMQVALTAGTLCIAIVTTLALVAGIVARGRAVETIGADMTRIATALADGLDHYMHARYQQVRAWARLEPLRALWGSDPARLRALLDEMQSSFPEYRWIGFVSVDGLVRVATRGVLENTSVAEWPSFRESLSGAVLQDAYETSVGDFAPVAAAARAPLHFVDVAFPVRTPDGRVVGVLGARVDWSWANELRDALRNSQRLAPDVELWVIGAGGEVLIGPEAGRQIFPDGLRQEMQAKVRGTFLDHDRGNMVTSYAVAEGFRDYAGLNWIVVARRPAAVAYARAHELGWIVLIVGTVVALFGATLVLLAADQLAAPLRALAKHADRIGRESSETMIARQRGSREMLTLSSALRSLLIRTAAGERPAEEVALKVAAPSHGEDPNAPGAPAGSDALTGLMSRGAFMTQAIDAMRYYKRYDRSIATLVLDIDRF